MALPAAIQQQEAEAEAIRLATYGAEEQPTSPNEGETPTEPGQPLAPPAPPPPAPPVAPEPAQPVQAAPQPSAPVEDATYWRQRFETLAGKYDAEMPRLHQQIREQGERLDQLTAAPQPQPGSPDTSQQDIENFGEDLVDFVRRTAQAAVLAERAEVERRFGAVTQQVEQVQHQVVKSEVDKFWEAVIDLVPDWLIVDKTPAWIQWLDTTPDYTELTYRELASQAINKGKPEKVAKLVEEWRKATGAVATPAPQPQPGPVLQLVPTPPQPTLSGQVAPSTVKSNGGAPVARQIITRAEYEAMYDVRNVQRFGEKKAAELIAAADLAVAEGRVQW